MEAGKLNRKILIQSRKTTVDSSGQPSDEWTDVCTPWANIKSQTGSATIKKSTFAENVESSINSFSFRIRFRKGLDAGMRIVYDGMHFDIKQVIPDLDTRECLYLVCTQGGNDG
jgi:SPP1 family predicted phage head-tail adaptor